MGKRRIDQDAPPPTRGVLLRISPELLTTLGAMADKRKISRNALMVAILTKALRGKRKEEAKG